MKISFYPLFFQHDDKYYALNLFVSRSVALGDNYITFTDMKNGHFYSFNSFLRKMYPDRDAFSSMIDSGTKIFFEKPFAFKAKSSDQMGKGSTCRGTIPYGDSYKFEVVGMFLYSTYPYTLDSRQRPEIIKLYDLE